MKRIMNINVFRQCLDCGYEQFELDEVGAENLLMRGDALFKDGDSEAVRLQVPYICDEAVTRIVDSAIEQYPEREFIAGHSLTTVKNVICRSFGTY